MADVATAQAPAGGGQAVKRSIARVIIFNILSPFYGLYWFYQTRGVVTRSVSGNDQVGLQTLGLLVPILNLFIIYWLLRDIDKLNRAAGGQGLPVPPVWMVLIPLIMALIPFVNFLAGIVGLVFYIFTLIRLNEGLTKQGATEAPYSTGEIAVVVLGVLFWIVYFVAIAAMLASFGHNAANVNTSPSTFSY